MNRVVLTSLKSLLALFFLFGCQTQRNVVEHQQFEQVVIDSVYNVIADSSVVKMIMPYRDALEKDMNKVLCRSARVMEGGRPESLLTNFFSDLLLDEARLMCEESHPEITIDVAMLNRGGLRSILSKGDVTVQSVFQMMPFENDVVALKLTGSVFNEFIQHIASRNGEGISGFSFGIKNHKGVNIKVDGEPLDVERTYWLVTSDYLANGGDGCSMLVKHQQRINLGRKLRDLFIVHLERMGTAGKMADAKLDGRIYHAE